MTSLTVPPAYSLLGVKTTGYLPCAASGTNNRPWALGVIFTCSLLVKSNSLSVIAFRSSVVVPEAAPLKIFTGADGASNSPE